MSNAAVGFDEGAVKPQRTEAGDGLHQALQDDLSLKKASEVHALASRQGDPSSEREMEEGHVDGAHRAQHGHVNTESMMQEGYGDHVHMAQHSESKVEKVPEEGLDDGIRRAQHGYVSGEKKMQESYGGGLHRAQQSDLSCEQKMEGGHGGEEAETRAKSPQHERATNAQNSRNSSLCPNLTGSGTLSEHGDLGAQANLAACSTSGKHHPDNVTSAQDSEDDADQDIGAEGRPIAAYMASSGTLGEHTYKNGFTNGTVRESAHKTTAAGGAPEQQAGEDRFANLNFYTEGEQPGNYPHKAISGNGRVGEDAQGYLCDDWGNVYDHTSRNYESDANVDEKMTACEETGGADFKINLGQDAGSEQAPPTFMKSPVKSGSLTSYYETQSAAMKNTGFALRFGNAVFSLITFSVIISTSEKRVAAGSTFYVKFSDYQAYNYLVALNLLSFLYSSGQLVLLAQARSKNILSSPVKWGVSVFLCDQMLAFLMISSSSSAATASELSRHGLRNIWPPACSTWKLSLFCSKADVAVAMSFLSFLFMLLSSFSSGHHLSKLLAD